MARGLRNFYVWLVQARKLRLSGSGVPPALVSLVDTLELTGVDVTFDGTYTEIANTGTAAGDAVFSSDPAYKVFVKNNGFINDVVYFDTTAAAWRAGQTSTDPETWADAGATGVSTSRPSPITVTGSSETRNGKNAPATGSGVSYV